MIRDIDNFVSSKIWLKLINFGFCIYKYKITLINQMM